MFLKKYRDRINEEFDDFCRRLPEPSAEIQKALCTLSEDTALVMKFFYGNMPYSDVGNYSLDVFLDYAQHGIALWRNSPYRKKIPEEIFLGEVLFYRVNEEEIKPCRKLFYEKLKDRIAGMSMEEAALEVNGWCAEEATYQSSDERTSSALDVFQKGYGRCGEESVFAVNALRSVGIPARQVYVPRWSHCDDNHAWVEVWCDGVWHYLGACEPEAVLDKGWFTNASSRAMMVHSRSFFDSGTENVVGKEGIVTIQNRLANYAETKTITIRVEDSDGCPVEEADIRAEVLNYSEFSPVAELITGTDGAVKLETGLGSLHISACFHGKYGECLIHTGKEDTCCCVLGEKAAENTWVDFDMTAPVDSVENQNPVSQERENENNRRIAEAAKIRKKKREAFRPPWLGKFLGDASELASEYMAVLSKKDREDADPKILTEHYEEARVYENRYPRDIFLSYVWNPRVEFEILSKWRRSILEYFTPRQRERFQKNPAEIWKWIEENIQSCTERERVSVYTVPAAALKLGFAEMKSKRVLFVAIARTLGIPSRLNSVDGSMEYWKNGCFVRVGKGSDKSAHLIITGEKNVSWNYFQNWSISRLDEEGYHSLAVGNVHLGKENSELDVEPGKYRVITANRLPTGNIFAKHYDFHIETGGHREVVLKLREACLRDMLDRHSIPDYELKDGSGKGYFVSELTKEEKRILFWLDVGKEPTEHILNELVERKEEYEKCQNQLLFILHGPEELEDTTLSKCRAALPDIKVLYDVFGKDLEMTARRMYVDPDKLPLLVVTDGPAEGIFGASGYSVGMADMLLRVLNTFS